MTYRVYIRNNSKVEIKDSLFPSSHLPLLLSILLVSFVFISVFSDFVIGKTSTNPSNDTAKTIELQLAPLNIQETQAQVLDITNNNDVVDASEAAITTTEKPIEIIALDDTQEHSVQPQDDYPVEIIEIDNVEPLHVENITHEKISSVTVHDMSGEETKQVSQPEETTERIYVAEKIATEDDLLGVINEQKRLLNESPVSSHPHMQEVVVKKGDSLALIFNRLGLSASTLHNIMQLSHDTKVLKSLSPGEIIKFDIKNNKLNGLNYDYDLTKTLVVKKDKDSFHIETIEAQIEKRLKYASAEINSSLFLAGQKAGINDKVIMNLVSIYGWDIDFALDIRGGDKFAILYEEHFKDGTKINNGPILAAEFINRGYKYRAVRYTHDNGDVNYYSDTGHNMRKAFIRTPVNFSRISSKFNLKRKHPVLNTIRAHKGVDYAARSGTPIKATGDGVISYKGTKGGYGRTIVIKHGGKYTTLYAHMSKYAKGMRSGARVKQGQTIGYVGSSGLATGPHLHYEFRINGAHRNPLKVKLPKALKIPDKIMADFKQQTRPILAQLDQYINQTASNTAEQKGNDQVLALSKQKSEPQRITQ